MSAQPVAVTRRMILVLGMHRSGTSAVAGTLAQLGVDFSARLIAPAPDNPQGFFEHADIWQQDHDILQALGSAWDDPLPLPEDWQHSTHVQQAAPRARAIVRRDFASAELAGIKDPRMCRLLPPWRDWLVAEGFAPACVLVVRQPAGVIASLAKRDQLPPAQAAWVWLRHMLEAERASRGLPRVIVAYEDLMRDWRTQTTRIADALGLTWPAEPAVAAARVDAFLQPDLRHHRDAASGDLLSDPLHGWVTRAHAAFSAAAGAEPTTARHADDTLAALLDQVAAEMVPLDQAGDAGAAVLRAARQRRNELERSLTWCDGERLAMVEGNAELHANLERHVQELTQTKLGAALLQEDIDRRVARLEELSAELADVSAQRARLDSELAQVRSQRAQIGAELTSVYASRSWRITRPLRGALRLAHRIVGGAPPGSQPPATPSTSVSTPPSGRPDVRDPAAVLAAAFAAANGPRVLIVTPDMLGPIRNGGIGTAFGALAQTLAQAGHAVTVLYTLGGHCEDGGDIARWQQHYAALGIRFVPIALEQGEPLLDAPHHAWRAYRVYLWLKQQQAEYDLAYFPEWKGEAYYALQAKRLGLDFAALRMIIVTHSSTTWAESGNYVVPQHFDDLLLEFLERRSTELADAVISPSQYMLEWMRRRGWHLSAPTHVIQNLMPDAPLQPKAVAASAFTITEWVFFGRLERRKGLIIFLDALARMPESVRERIQITFLGKAIHTPDYDSASVIGDKLGTWTLPPKVIADFDRDQALAYLQQPGRVAVIASLVENSPYTVLECVLRRIPFIAADVGGIAELVHADDRERALFKPTPTGLTAILLGLDGARYTPPRPAVASADTRQRWLDLQGQLLHGIPPLPVEPLAPAPHITVCLVHYDRPALLAQAIDSLRQQTYAHFDVVLVEDGSPSQPAQQYLDSLQAEFAWRGWSIVRQANAYLGAARNAAVRHARGDYMLFMDDDNLAKPHELAVFAHAARISNADILTTVSDVFNAADGAPQPGQASRQLWIPLGNAAGLGVFRNVFGDANALVRRETFLELGGFTEDYGIGHEDWEFFARAALAGANLQLVPEPLFWYRVNATSMLRGGDTLTDLARSARPYWEGFPEGIGPALAYAARLHSSPVAATSAGYSYEHRLLRVITGMFRADTRSRFREVLTRSGWRATLAHIARYIRLHGPQR